MALDNETIVGEDLVAWVMAGIVHVPRSEVFASLGVMHRHSDTHRHSHPTAMTLTCTCLFYYFPSPLSAVMFCTVLGSGLESPHLHTACCELLFCKI